MTSNGSQSYDLTAKVSPYLDLHMMFPLLEYIDGLITSGEMSSYSSTDVATARLALLRPTHMVDYAMDIYKELHGDDSEIPAEMEEQKKTVYKQMEELKSDQGCKAFDDLCNNEEIRSKLVKAGEWNIPALSQKSSSEEGFAVAITAEVVETYRTLAKFNFDCGDYMTAKTMLTNVISLHAVAPLPKTDDGDDMIDVEDDRNSRNDKSADSKQKTGNPNVYYLTSINTDLLQILWGKLSCEILVENWEEASIALTAVKLSIEQLVYMNQLTALEALKQRTWLLHWSLFVFWNEVGRSGNSGGRRGKGKAGGLESMVELFFTEKYLQAITTNAPHLLRYLTAAVLLCKRRVAKSTSKDGRSSGAEARKLMKDLVRLMNNCEYSDPIVEFVDCLCVKFDFEGAQTKLAECENLLKTDFFLCKRTALFMEEARVFVFENYCRIHDKVDLSVLATKLAMDQEAAEHWIVDLIRNALLDAKIDSENGCVVMGPGADSRSVYEQVMGKTRDLNLRSASLAQNLKNFVADVKKQTAKRERAAMEEE